MLSKILFTALVMVVVFAVQRARSRGAQAIPAARLVPPVRRLREMPSWVRPAAYLFAGSIVASSAVYYYTTWQDNQRVVTIRVINTNSGDVASYEAHKGSIDGRSFETIDGLHVRIADAERVEVIHRSD
jgi:hypothetical protein